MLSKVLLVLPAVIAGVAAEYEDCTPVELCIDGVNDCGVRWGGCYDRCDPDARPTPPPCETLIPPTTTEEPTTTHTLIPPTSIDPEDDCSTRTVCWDGINDCGMMYGGCFADCKPWPTFEPPPCPTSSTWGTVTTTVSARPECEDGDEHSICVDKVNECGMWYGGCYDYCATPTPEFEVPTCSEATGHSPTETPEPTKTKRAEEPTETDGGGFPSIEETCEEEGTLIICVDGIDDCGHGWGACYNACTTSIEKPTTPCSTTAAPTEPEPSVTNCADITICVDYINDCGMMYGGCHSVCSPTPSYTAPPCPSATETKDSCSK